MISDSLSAVQPNTRGCAVSAKGLWLLTLFLLCSSAQAQYVIGGMRYVCPVGANWDDPRCIREPMGASESASMRSLRWRLTWGAVAIDPKSGDIGMAVGKLSKRAAKREAMDSCRRFGAMGCKSIRTYENECVAVAWSSIPGGRAAVESGRTVDRANSVALAKCAKSSGGDCRIAYSGCTQPIFAD